MTDPRWTRRDVLLTGAALGSMPLAGLADERQMMSRPIPASGERLPEWALEFAASWGQFFLKFIVSHPAVTCVIPATSKPHHMRDNLEAGFGELPDAATRKRMVAFIREL